MFPLVKIQSAQPIKIQLAATHVELHKSFGPFRNVGGGDVPKGDEAYIQFYKPEKKK